MGNRSKSRRRDDVSSSSSASSSDEGSETSRERERRHRKSRRGHKSSDRSSRKDKERKREREEKRRRRKERGRDRKRSKSKNRDYKTDSESEPMSGSDEERPRVDPEDVVKEMMGEFPNVGGDLKLLLQMIDDGQAVDIKGISERSLIKHLKKLFISLNLKQSGDRVFLLPSNARPTLEVVGPFIKAQAGPDDQLPGHSVPSKDSNSTPTNEQQRTLADDYNLAMPPSMDDAPGPRRRVIGPQMPSAELLAAAAKLTEAQADLREAELEDDNELFIGPAPPAMVAEAESANEAERFEEVTRIMDAEDNSPYDVVGVNHNMSADNIKKRYWKLSLLVHPDKCSHPHANEAFIKLNKAFKDLQDPDKRKVMDDKIKLKEEQEQFKVELKAMREAAQWRRIQGISMEGDDELLAEPEVKLPPKRDDWMTSLPPERRPGGIPTQSTTFSKGTKEGRGDTTIWTDSPLDRAQKAKMNYLEAYNEAAALASNEEEKMKSNADADLVDKYNKSKRSKSLMQKHQEEASKRVKKKSKHPQEKQEWTEQHPWKPWDREKDLVAGRQSVNLDSNSMAQGLTSKFASGTFQRNFL